MNWNITNLESVTSFRKGANAQGVRAELPEDQIPREIQILLQTKKGGTQK